MIILGKYGNLASYSNAFNIGSEGELTLCVNCRLSPLVPALALLSSSSAIPSIATGLWLDKPTSHLRLLNYCHLSKQIQNTVFLLTRKHILNCHYVVL